jgi:hypothetical protein
MKTSEKEPTIFNIKDSKGEIFPLYTEFGNIHIPQCEEVYNIENIKSTKKCYKNIPIIAKKYKKT